MLINCILYNLNILWFKVIRKKHPEQYNEYKFRSLQDYTYKIEYSKDPYDFFSLDLYSQASVEEQEEFRNSLEVL